MTSPTAAPAIELFDLPHSEARALLRRGAPVFLGVDPVEYHGPHLSLHNDRLISTGLARDLSAALRASGDAAAREWPCVLATNLEVGVEPTAGAGSRAVDYAAVRRLVTDACHALYELGARRLVVMTFHGAPMHSVAIHHAVRAFTARGGRALSPMNLVLRELIEPGGLEPYEPMVAHIADERERAEVLAGLPVDFHAGYAETSLALHYAPASVSDAYRALPDCPRFEPVPGFVRAAAVARAVGREELARELAFAGLGVAWSRLRPFPGYTSRPRHADARAGAWLARRITELSARACRAVFDGTSEAPPPVMAWLEALTLGGRVPGVSIPLDAVKQF